MKRKDGTVHAAAGPWFKPACHRHSPVALESCAVLGFHVRCLMLRACSACEPQKGPSGTVCDKRLEGTGGFLAVEQLFPVSRWEIVSCTHSLGCRINVKHREEAGASESRSWACVVFFFFWVYALILYA